MRSLRIAMLATAALSLASCGAVKDFSIVRANRLYREGYAHEAAALYLKAGAGTEPIASYDLANAFASLGEAESARPLFDVAIAAGDAGVAARSWYNRGAAAFSDADYESAADSFRKAIEAFYGQKDETLRRELSRAYELAIVASDDAIETGAIERGRYGSGKSGGDQQPLSLSRMSEKTLFMPGGAETGTEVDH